MELLSLPQVAQSSCAASEASSGVCGNKTNHRHTRRLASQLLGRRRSVGASALNHHYDAGVRATLLVASSGDSSSRADSAGRRRKPRRYPAIPASHRAKGPALSANPCLSPVRREAPRPACHAGGRGFESRRSRSEPPKVRPLRGHDDFRRRSESKQLSRRGRACRPRRRCTARPEPLAYGVTGCVPQSPLNSLMVGVWVTWKRPLPSAFTV